MKYNVNLLTLQLMFFHTADVSMSAQHSGSHCAHYLKCVCVAGGKRLVQEQLDFAGFTGFMNGLNNDPALAANSETKRQTLPGYKLPPTRRKTCPNPLCSLTLFLPHLSFTFLFIFAQFLSFFCFLLRIIFLFV